MQSIADQTLPARESGLRDYCKVESCKSFTSHDEPGPKHHSLGSGLPLTRISVATYFNPLDSLSGLVFIDLFAVGVGLLGSLGFALNITIGLAQTCNTLGRSVSCNCVLE